MHLDRKSFREIYDLYFLELCSSLNSYTRDLQMIEDTVQEVFVTLWEKSLIIDVVHIRAYLHTAARNSLFNKMKKNVKVLNTQEVVLESLENEVVNDEEDSRLEKVRQSISLLPPKCREIFFLHYYNGLTAKQVADIKGVSLKTVENQITIALKKIRTEFF